MRTTRIITDLTVPDIEAAREFYTDFLGLKSQDLGLDWVTRFVSADGQAYAQLVTTDATAPMNPQVSVNTDDIEAAYAEAQERGYEIVYPLTKEPWGIRRFFVRAPDGNVLNINSHPA